MLEVKGLRGERPRIAEGKVDPVGKGVRGQRGRGTKEERLPRSGSTTAAPLPKWAASSSYALRKGEENGCCDIGGFTTKGNIRRQGGWALSTKPINAALCNQNSDGRRDCLDSNAARQPRFL